ncbi:hypothetical protein DQG23_02285 [Paenibacillus contaminans]|uniref:SLH domain-containing protein n=2 Tax=Paenibacillus contaminans TaxID=450362 RepID=A0A329MU10_9BACL|nr:hypothetical protein DQG23_02285 [Paenibacillus contaminans]
MLRSDKMKTSVTNKTKRVVCLFMVVLLLLSSDLVLPPHTAAAEEPQTVTYSFNQSSLVPGTSDWQLVGAPYGEFTPGVAILADSINIEAWADGHARSFKFNVPEAGAYTVKLQGIVMTLGGISRLHVDGKPIGIFDFYAESSWDDWVESEARAIRVMNLEAGIHELTIEAIGHATGSTRRNMFPTKLILEKVQGALAVQQVQIKWNPQELNVGTRTPLSVEALLADGTPAVLPGAQISFASADQSVAVVEAQTGWLEAVGIGTTTIEASVLYEGNVYTADLPIEVKPGHTYAFNKSSLNPGTSRWKLVGAPYGEYEPGVALLDDSINIEAYADGHSRSFKFYVSKTAPYTVKLQGIVMTLGGISELFVDGQPIGTFDFYSTASWDDWLESEARTIRLMNLSAGMHELTIKAIGHTTGSTRRNMFPTKFILEPFEGPLPVQEVELKADSAELSLGARTQLTVEATLTDGTKIALPDAQISYQSMDEAVAVVDAQSGMLEAAGVGETVINVSVVYFGATYTGSLPVKVIPISSVKKRSTLYTEAEVQAARSNVSQFDWAKSMRDNAVAQADLYLGQGLDFLWNLVPPQSLPRSIFVNFELGSPVTGKEIDKYGYYPYLIDPIGDPWKITDPSSGYRFPTNDFKSYYESGLNEHGIFDRSLADPAFLVNTLYPEKGPTWGVDDGNGWIDENGNYYTFIAYYVQWGLWGYDGKSAIQKALRSLRDAYLYTGDVKYARGGTVLLDRIADVYPSLDISVYSMEHYFNSHGGFGLGKAVGNIWEPFLVKDFLSAYDAFFPAMDDSQLIGFLTAKSQQYRLGPLKHSATGIRKNIEDNIVKLIYPAIKNAQIASNNGIHQGALAMAAVVYDKLPESKEWMDFNYKSGGQIGPPHQVTGGNMGVTFVNGVDRDGVGHESSPGYNQLWLDAYLETADILNGYDGFDGADLYDHVKFRKMFSGLYPLMLGERFTANIGDASGTGNPWYAFNLTQMIKAFENYGDPIFAQLAYFANNNSIEGIHGDIFSANPDQIASGIQNVINEQGTLKLDSINMTGYGFAALRDGEKQGDIVGARYPFQQLPIVSKTGNGAASIKNGTLEFAGTAVGDSIEFSFDVALSGSYEVLLQPARSIWYGGSGTYLVKLDGQPVGEIDFYGNRQSRESFGIVPLGAGTHSIQFIATGKNPNSGSYKMALYELALLDEEQRLERNETIGTDPLRDLWMYYGRNYGHGHGDTLNLGLVAFGLDLSPDLGYPESTLSTDTHFTEWVRHTVSHNTVLVDRSMQNAHWSGQPSQFDDTDIVKLVDVESPDVYPQTELYKRTSAMIRVDEGHSYVVDFFRVKGGNEHHFSFHGAEGQAAAEGLNLTPQLTGTYEGPDVEYGVRTSDEYGTGYQYKGSGFHYLKNVERDSSPESQFSVDWAIEDTWNILAQPEDIHLRLTMLTETDEVALADGIPSRTQRGNPESLRYMIAKRTGTNLQSTFTSVIEPYKDDRFVSTIENAAVKTGGAAANEMEARAVKVTLVNGRVDYIISALNPEITYTVDDKLQFKGSFGVYSEMDDRHVYSYVNDGTVIGLAGSPEIEANLAGIAGTVADFTKQLQINNEIIAEMDLQGHPAEELVNRMIYVQNDGLRNAVYTIKGVKEVNDGTYSIELGDTSLIRSYKNDNDFSEGFIYDIAAGATFRIPLSYEHESLAGIGAKLAKSKLAVGEASQIAVTGKRLDGGDVPLTGVVITYESDNEEVATVTVDGMVMGQGAGEANVTVQAVIQGVAMSTSVIVQVEEEGAAVTLERIAISGVPGQLRPSESAQAAVTAHFTDLSSLNVTSDAVFSSSNSAVASVSAEGRVTALSQGTTIVSAVYGEFEAAVELSVVPVVLPDTSAPSSGEGAKSQEEPGKQTVISLTTDAIKESLETGKRLSVPQGIAEIRLPTSSAELLGEKRLELNIGGIGLDLSGEWLRSILTDAQLTDNKVQLVIRFEIIEGQEADVIVGNAATHAQAALTLGGAIFDLNMSLVMKDGRSVPVNRFSEVLTLSFPAPEDADSAVMGIFHIGEEGQLEYVGGELKDGRIEALLRHLSRYGVLEYDKAFADVPVEHWAYNVIRELSAKQIVQGVSGTGFAPLQPVTRAEFTALLVRALQLELAGKAPFTDVASEAWYSEAIAAAVDSGLVDGIGDGRFAPNDEITREQMAAMLLRAYEWKTGKKTELAESTAVFQDNGEISGWAKSFVNAARQLELVQGRENDRFVPLGLTSRAESAQAVYNLLRMIR